MKNKIITICLILIVIVCIGITQLPGIYAVPTDYTDYYGMVISKDDSFHNNLPNVLSSGPICFTFRTKDSNNDAYPHIYKDDPGFVATYQCTNTRYDSKPYIFNTYNNPFPDIPIPSQENEESFWNYIFTISKYWKIEEMLINTYNVRMLKLLPYEYIEPEYKIECNPTEIAPGETSQCELKVNYHSRIKSLNFKLDTDQYNINNVEAGEEFEDLQVSDGVYSLSSKSSLEDSEEGRTTTILSFIIKSEGNTVASADNIKVVDLEYHDELSESPKITASATVTQNKQEKTDIKNIINNPKTRNNILVIILLLTIIISSVLISNRNKEKGK